MAVERAGAAGIIGTTMAPGTLGVRLVGARNHFALAARRAHPALPWRATSLLLLTGLGALAFGALACGSSTGPSPTPAPEDPAAQDKPETGATSAPNAGDPHPAESTAAADATPPVVVTPDPATPVADQLAAERINVPTAPCNAAQQEHPAGLAVTPDGDVVGTCTNFSNTSGRLWRYSAQDKTLEVLLADRPYGLDEVLIDPQHPTRLFATYHDGGGAGDGGWLLVDSELSPGNPTLSPLPDAEFVHGLAITPNDLFADPMLTVVASNVSLTELSSLPGKLATFDVVTGLPTTGCPVLQGGVNLTSAGFATLGDDSYWLVVDTGQYAKVKQPDGKFLYPPAEAGSLLFVSTETCTVTRTESIKGGLGLAGTLSIATTPEGFRAALPSSRNEAGFYVAHATAQTFAVEPSTVPSVKPVKEHFINSATFGPLGTGLFACDLRQKLCWWLGKDENDGWSVQQSYDLYGLAGRAVWGSNGVWLTDGNTLSHIPAAQ